MERFLETADIARRAEVTPGLVRRDAAEGKLEAAAETERGSRLFRSDAARGYIAMKRARRAARIGKGGRQ